MGSGRIHNSNHTVLVVVVVVVVVALFTCVALLVALLVGFFEESEDWVFEEVEVEDGDGEAVAGGKEVEEGGVAMVPALLHGDDRPGTESVPKGDHRPFSKKKFGI